MAEGAQAKNLEEKMRELAVTATDKNPKDITLSRIKTADFLEKKHFELLDRGLFASIVKQIGSKNKAIPLNKANCDLFVSQLAHKAVCEKTGKKDLPMEDESVVAEKDKIYHKIMTHKVKTLETKTANKGSVSRLTDTSKYTGTHGQRFDAEGKGKGAAGRVDKVENTGYVGQYKGQDTFGKK